MSRTIFNTPILTPLLHWFGHAYLFLSGWEVTGEPPREKRYVMIAGPHTSNWDFWILVLVMFKYRQRIHWLGKQTLFPRYFSWFSRWLGGIAVDRSKAHNMADQVADVYRASERMVVLITPEGTRSKVTRWRTGFYHIAMQAKIPVVLTYADFSAKKVGWGPMFEPSGDIDADMPKMRAFYRGIKGKRPELGMD